MDPALVMMLSNLLQLQSQADPATSLLSSPPSSPSSFLSSSSAAAAAPLLFFALSSALSSALSFASSSSSSSPPSLARRPRRRRRPPSSSSASPSPPRPPRSSASLILSLPSDPHIFSMDPSARDSRFRSLYGLSYPVFASLLDQLLPLFPSLSLPLPPDQSLALALSRLSRGLSSRALSRLLHPNLPPPLISRATHALTRLLSTRFYSDYVKLPPSHRLLQSTSAFRDLCSLPNLAAAIASSAVRIRRSADPSLRSPNRPFPSILLQAVADHRRIFLDACVRAPGSSDPASHLRDSSLYRRLCNSDALRDPALQVCGHPVRPFIIGDSSFPLLPFLLKPFSASVSPSSSSSVAAPSEAAQEAFDAALAKARAASVEPAVALLKGRWKILRNLNVGMDHAAQTVVACVVLHNFCQIEGEPEDEGKYLWRDPPESPQLASLAESERSLYYAGDAVRQALAEDLYERQQRLSGGTASR